MSPDLKSTIIHNLLHKGVTSCIEKDSLIRKLEDGKKLRVKFGVDPTGSQLHIGHAVPILKLAEFQKLGHQVIIMIGDATAQVGDSTDRDSERPMLTREQTRENAKNYIQQFAKIIDIDRVEIRYNSDWLDQVNFCMVGEIAKNFSVTQMLDRDMFARRIQEGKRISLQEFLYPLMQGYDSVALHADVEIGGNDQYFNLMAGRPIQESFGQAKQDILTFELLEGTDGRKMSKSYNNFISLEATPNDMFVKIMEIHDSLIIKYFTNATQLYLDEMDAIRKRWDDGESPRTIKMLLAHTITTMYHGKQLADDAQMYFEKSISQGERPDDKDIPVYTIEGQEMPLVTIIRQIGMVGNSTEARNALAGGGVKVDEHTIRNANTMIALTDEKILIQVGKKKFGYIIKK